VISPTTIDEIKNRIDILEVVGDFVDLKKSGSSYKALSPFTSEKTPSFYVVPSKGIFKDFSSGKGGDAITFVMEVDGLSYVEALKYLANKYGIEVEEEVQTDEMQAAQNRRESLFIVMNYANDLFKNLLHDHEEGKAIGLSYFEERGFSHDIIGDFELGYTLQEWDFLHKTATEKGYQEDLLEEAGLIVRKENKTYDRFRGRVTFPIHNITGKVIAFGARTLSKEKNQPKYLNSPETELYNKSRVLYGLYQSKQYIRQLDNCYLVEGYTDVISMHQAGVKNVVSSSGTSLTEDQVKLISRYSKNVTVLFDGDAAGIRASIRGIDMLLEGGLNVRAVPLPDGEDPDSYSKSLGTSAFQHFLETEVQDIIFFKTKLLLDEVENDPIKKSEVIREVVQTIAKISDPVKRSLYLKECSALLDISESILVAEQNKLLIEQGRKKQSEPSAPVEPLPIMDEVVEKPKVQKIYYQEYEAIRILLNYGNHIILGQGDENLYVKDYFINEISELDFQTPIFKRILDRFRERVAEDQSVDSEYFLSLEDDEIQKVVVDLITKKHEATEDGWTKKEIPIVKEDDDLKKLAFRHVLRLKYRILRHLHEEERQKLNRKDIPDEEELILIEECMQIKNLEDEIAGLLGIVTAD